MRRRVKLLMAGMAAFGLYKLATAERRQAKQQAWRPAAPRGKTSPAEREHWDEVDEASYESFPASDPPAYSRGRH